MDFTTNRSGQSRVNGTVSAPQPNQPINKNTGNDMGGKPKHVLRVGGKWWKLSFLTLLYSGTILVVALLLYINIGSPAQEAKYVEKNKLQAVFVNVNGTNGGQVYFGNIKDLNSQYVRLTNVFYIQNQQTGTTQSSQSYTLVKLGCELHGPEDQMIINRDQVFFWENLKSDGQVAQKVADYYKQNPKGQDCSASSSSSSTSQSGASTQSSTNSASAATGTTGSSAATKKP